MVASILIEITNKNVDKTFDYKVPPFLIDKIKLGLRVIVPFGKIKLEGFVLKIKDTTDYSKELKEIIDVVDNEVVLNEELLSLGQSIKEQTLSSLISCYQAMLPTALKANIVKNIKIKTIEIALLNQKMINHLLNEKEQELINIVKENKYTPLSKLRKISLYTTNNLLKKGIIQKELVEEYLTAPEKDFLIPKLPLTPLQQNAVNEIINSQNKTQVFLLHGVTGSGKTEVYMELIEKVIEEGKTAIVLVPEISLTPQIVERFKNRFGKIIAILHSRLSQTEKYDEWRKICKKEVKIVIGARSAIFAPLENIGIIIVDEEHSTTYKQECNPRYNAIEVAKQRSIYHNCKIVLGSATPTLESYARARKNVYKLVEMPSRINNHPLPKVQIVDMTKSIKQNNSYFSKELLSSMKEKLEKDEQVILLLNRRGYSTYTTCKSCGETIKCPNCDITLTYHKTSNTLRCHYCGYGTKKDLRCPKCHELSMSEYGTGTEKIEEELNNLFPSYKTVRMDIDTTSKKGMHEKIINDFKEKKYSILLGTQMIAKGLDFKDVTLVGVINADTSLNIPDFRSSEYTYQLLNQVAGRSGRSDKEGIVIIQTFNKDHYAIKYASTHDYKGFYTYEMSIRNKLNYPPYYFLITVKIKGKDQEIIDKESIKTMSYLTRLLPSTIILGPTQNVRINNIYSKTIIIKYKKCDNIKEILEDLISHYISNNKINIEIDFNPNYM